MHDIDARPTRTIAHLRFELHQHRGVGFAFAEHGSVRQVLDPTGDTETGRGPLHEPTEADALDAALDAVPASDQRARKVVPKRPM